MIGRLKDWRVNRRVRALVAEFPERFVITGKVDGLLTYEYTPWWAERRRLLDLPQVDSNNRV